MYEFQIAPIVDQQLIDARRLLELGETEGLVLLESLTRAQRASLELIDTRLEESRALNHLRALAQPSEHSISDSNEVHP